jgi:hypothetical protein
MERRPEEQQRQGVKTGCSGSSSRDRPAQAPPSPSLTSTSGPKQHALAPNAASTPASNGPRADPD